MLLCDTQALVNRIITERVPLAAVELSNCFDQLGGRLCELQDTYMMVPCTTSQAMSMKKELPLTDNQRFER